MLANQTSTVMKNLRQKAITIRSTKIEGEKISNLDNEHGQNICSEIVFSKKCIQNIMYWQIYLE